MKITSRKPIDNERKRTTEGEPRDDLDRTDNKEAIEKTNKGVIIDHNWVELEWED